MASVGNELAELKEANARLTTELAELKQDFEALEEKHRAHGDTFACCNQPLVTHTCQQCW